VGDGGAQSVVVQSGHVGSGDAEADFAEHPYGESRMITGDDLDVTPRLARRSSAWRAPAFGSRKTSSPSMRRSRPSRSQLIQVGGGAAGHCHDAPADAEGDVEHRHRYRMRAWQGIGGAQT
jgi:hypothetical protein